MYKEYFHFIYSGGLFVLVGERSCGLSSYQEYVYVSKRRNSILSICSWIDPVSVLPKHEYSVVGTTCKNGKSVMASTKWFYEFCIYNNQWYAIPYCTSSSKTIQDFHKSRKNYPFNLNSELAHELKWIYCISSIGHSMMIGLLKRNQIVLFNVESSTSSNTSCGTKLTASQGSELPLHGRVFKMIDIGDQKIMVLGNRSYNSGSVECFEGALSDDKSDVFWKMNRWSKHASRKSGVFLPENEPRRALLTDKPCF